MPDIRDIIGEFLTELVENVVENSTRLEQKIENTAEEVLEKYEPEARNIDGLCDAIAEGITEWQDTHLQNKVVAILQSEEVARLLNGMIAQALRNAFSLLANNSISVSPAAHLTGYQNLPNPEQMRREVQQAVNGTSSQGGN